MKCISLWQPYATLVVIAAKWFETRHWSTPFRGPLLIHAAKTKRSVGIMYDTPFQRALIPAGYRMAEDLPFGCIVGAVDLLNCWLIHRPGGGAGSLWAGNRSRPMPRGDELFFGDFGDGRYAWELAKPRRFPTPIPYRGFQSFFDVPESLVADQMVRAMTLPPPAPVGGEVCT
jgi:hypothetical protein